MKNKLFTIVILSALMSSLYALTVRIIPAGHLMEFKKMISLTSPDAALELNLRHSRYLLKIKHQSKPGLTKKVFINGADIVPFRVREKEIETAWFYIAPPQITGTDKLSIKFKGGFPPDIDVRMNNFIALPRDELSNDIFILFKSPAALPQFNLPRWTRAFCLFFAFYYACLLFLRRRNGSAVFYIALSSTLFAGFAITVSAANLLPFNPYCLYFSPFFFCLVFLLSYGLILILSYPLKKGIIDNTTKDD
ncbi:MAG: hypothetical protein WC532_02195 [Candidatus Omnitrophota bacterium]